MSILSSTELPEFVHSTADKVARSVYYNSCAFLKVKQVHRHSFMAAPYLVFVYGTLKRGEPNHHVMFEGEGKADFVGTGKTKAKYYLLSIKVVHSQDLSFSGTL